MKVMKLATPEESKECWDAARLWWNGTLMHIDAISNPTFIVAEFLANQKGFTLFPYLEGKAYNGPQIT